MEQNPYQPPSADLNMAGGAPEYAGFWRRAGASIIDSFAIALLTLPLVWLIYGEEYFTSTEPQLVQGGADFIISYILPFALVIGFWVWRSATPGKMLLGIKIIDKNGDKPSTLRFIGRYFAYIPSALIFCLGFLWVAFDKKKRGWHDMLAGTLVVKE